MPEKELICLIGNTEHKDRYAAYMNILAKRENTVIFDLMAIKAAFPMDAIPEKNQYTVIKLCLDLCGKIAFIPPADDEEEGKTPSLDRRVAWQYINHFPGIPVEDLPEIEDKYK